MKTHRRVQFAETDASGRVHFTEILRWVEEAEHTCLRDFGIPVFENSTSGWPRVSVECDYQAPFFFQDEVEVTLSLLEIGESSLSWGFEVCKEGAAQVAATGKLVTVYVQEGGKKELPESWKSRLSVAFTE